MNSSTDILLNKMNEKIAEAKLNLEKLELEKASLEKRDPKTIQQDNEKYQNGVMALIGERSNASYCHQRERSNYQLNSAIEKGLLSRQSWITYMGSARKIDGEDLAKVQKHKAQAYKAKKEYKAECKRIDSILGMK